MSKKLRIYIGSSAKENYITIPNCEEFFGLLRTCPISDIEVIRFGPELEEDTQSEAVGVLYDIRDCAVALIEKAQGKILPQCIVEPGIHQKDLLSIINHYTKSYKFDNYCSEIVN